MATEFRTRASISGKLGEEFIERKFGIKEDENYEFKSIARRNNQVVLKVIQLIRSGKKHFVIVRYDRGRRRLKRGPRKGTYVPASLITTAYKKKLDIFVVRGFDLLNLIAREKRVLMVTQFEKDGEWAYYWTVRINTVSESLQKVFEDDEAVVYANPLDLPGFLKPAEDVEEVKEDFDDEVPF